MRKSAIERPMTFCLEAIDYVREPQDQVNDSHFGRMVYFRMAEEIIKILTTAKLARKDAA